MGPCSIMHGGDEKSIQCSSWEKRREEEIAWKTNA
jgi:hypothetical protein